jgi:hypothetical protein
MERANLLVDKLQVALLTRLIMNSQYLMTNAVGFSQSCRRRNQQRGVFSKSVKLYMPRIFLCSINLILPNGLVSASGCIHYIRSQTRPK